MLRHCVSTCFEYFIDLFDNLQTLIVNSIIIRVHQNRFFEYFRQTSIQTSSTNKSSISKQLHITIDTVHAISLPFTYSVRKNPFDATQKRIHSFQTSSNRFKPTQTISTTYRSTDDIIVRHQHHQCHQRFLKKKKKRGNYALSTNGKRYFPLTWLEEDFYVNNLNEAFKVRGGCYGAVEIETVER